MRCLSSPARLGANFAFVAALAFTASWSFAQTTIQPQAGVVINAEGVLSLKMYNDPSGMLLRERIAAAKASLDPKVMSASKLRKISLNRLEAAMLARQGVPTDEMKYLAGLQRIEYIFFYPDSKDIVLAGPAEGWIADVANRVVGIGSGRPVVQLQDLVAGLRAFPPGGEPTGMIGCSIDPTPEGQAAVQQYLNSIPRINPNIPPQTIAEGIRTNMGYHTVSVSGVSPSTHFAQVLVEADYRMKLIGLGLEKPPVDMAVFVDKAKAGDLARNALVRWYFLPDYQCVRVNDDKTAMEIVGGGVKLVGENELVSMSGQRTVVGGTSKASQTFTNAFTKLYPKIAARSPIFADLRNMIDIAVAAAFIQQQNYYGKADWKMEFLGDENSYRIENYSVPKTVATAVNVIWKPPASFMTPMGGGVEIQAAKAVQADKLLPDEKGTVGKLREQLKPNLADGQWWWD
ncbi:MAG: DUF1598 domain-containing protein [Pirellulales bacterium]|nr:DUF1598 domain-containing protein [Pirellulales bacterium]